MDPEGFDPNVAHITDGGHVFQVLNADGSDWDEEATRLIYETWKAEQ